MERNFIAFRVGPEPAEMSALVLSGFADAVGQLCIDAEHRRRVLGGLLAEDVDETALLVAGPPFSI